MALTDKLTNPPQAPQHGLPCSIGELLKRLNAGRQTDELDALHAMLYELKWDAGRIYDALRDEGYTVGRQSINRHRGQKCRCFKDAA